MGITFDWLRCEYLLPCQEVQDALFQTIDLFGCLDTYILSSGGRLLLPRYRHEQYQIINYGYVDILHHGELQFCTMTRPPACKFIAFKAQFWEGQMTSLEEIDP